MFPPADLGGLTKRREKVQTMRSDIAIRPAKATLLLVIVN